MKKGDLIRQTKPCGHSFDGPVFYQTEGLAEMGCDVKPSKQNFSSIAFIRLVYIYLDIYMSRCGEGGRAHLECTIRWSALGSD
jgi:hypothetical protein